MCKLIKLTAIAKSLFVINVISDYLKLLHFLLGCYIVCNLKSIVHILTDFRNVRNTC